MKQEDSALSTKKTGSKTDPFTTIVEHEKAEAARLDAVQQELQTEWLQAKDAAAEELTKAESYVKEVANKELAIYKDGEPAETLKDAKKAANKRTKALKAAFAAQAPDVAKNIVSTYLQAL